MPAQADNRPRKPLVFKTGRAEQPSAWKVRFLRRLVQGKREDCWDFAGVGSGERSRTLAAQDRWKPPDEGADHRTTIAQRAPSDLLGDARNQF